MKPPHRLGDYHVRSRQLNAASRANPNTRCQAVDEHGNTCGKLLHEHRHKNGKAAHWTAGHVRRGDPNSPLRPEASTCAAAEGGRITTAARRRRATPNTTANPRSDVW